MTRVKKIDLQQLAHLRDVSQKISSLLHQTLTGYLAPLSALLAPSRVLGEHLDGFSRERLPGADKCFAELQASYLRVCRDFFSLPAKLRSPVPAIKAGIEVYPLEYLYTLGGEGGRTIRITSPVSWVIAYDYPYTLSSLVKAQLAGEKPQPEETKQLLINSITMKMAFDRSEGIKAILTDLRFPVSVVTSPVSGDLPYTVVQAAVPSFRPQDELIQTVIQLSGKPVFEELVDLERVDSIIDPLQQSITDLL